MVKRTIDTGNCRALIEALPDAAIVVDKTGRIIMANTLTQEMFGYARDELIGKPVEMLVPERSRAAHERGRSGWFSKPTTQPMGLGLNLAGRRRDGAEFPADISLSSIETEQGIMAMATVRDITAIKHAEDRLLEEKQRLETVTDFANCAFFALDAETKVVYANKVAEKWFGPIKRMKGKFCRQVFQLSDPEMECAGLEVVRTGQSVRRETFAKLADGTERYVFLDATPVKNSRGEIEQIIEMAIDMTKYKQADDTLREANERFTALVRASPLAITAYDSNGIVGMWNEAAAKIFGWREAEVVGKALPIVPDDGQAEWRDIRDRVLSGETIAGKEVKRLRRDGSIIDAGLSSAPMRDASGRVTGIMAALEDITERKAAEARIAYLGYHDSLTDLPNRALLKERLNQTLALADRGRKNLALLHLGLDQFKMINDAYGHRMGDKLLKAVAGRLGRGLRREDTLARVGGDEFSIVLPDIKQAQNAAKVARALLDTLSEPFAPDGKEIYVSAAVGISIYPADGTRAAVLITNAEHAMRHAKREGRNRYRFFTSGLQARVTERLSLGNSLIHALERHEFIPYYQPHVDIAGGRIVGMEALARWRHPKRGIVMPDEFIPVAEETGLITAVGEEILRMACEQNRAWQDAGFRPLSVAVNLSAVQLRQADLVDTVRRILKETRLPARYLTLELTETAIMENVEVSATVMRALKSLGVHLAIDDFGTGYSSLASLTNFPFDALKIDKAFIGNMVGDAKMGAIVGAIISLAHNLNLNVIAEGVETKAQLNFLRRLDGDAIQGFLFCVPLPPADFEALLKEERRWPIGRAA